MTNLEKRSRIIRYFWPCHSKLSMLRACQGLVAAMSFIKGSELFLEACFILVGLSLWSFQAKR